MPCMGPNMIDGDILWALNTNLRWKKCYDRWVSRVVVVVVVVWYNTSLVAASPWGRDTDSKLYGIAYSTSLRWMLLTDLLFFGFPFQIDIPFETESQLRDKGSSRTPDILLQCPIGVKVGSEWRVVCWIDSKVCQLSWFVL